MSPDQIILLGLLATAITFVLRLLASYTNYHPGRVVINIVLFIISAGLALLWAHAQFPAWPQWNGDLVAFANAVWDYLNALVALGAPILGSATLIYNFLYEKVVVPLWVRLSAK
jgi:hypothetical protein